VVQLKSGDNSINEFNVSRFQIERTTKSMFIRLIYSFSILINVDWLNRKFGPRWLGTFGPIRWPAGSPELTPLYFWFCGKLQNKVYLTSPENEEALREKIIDACR
jgi:hypothetical protein